jgi:hypothetical protein
VFLTPVMSMAATAAQVADSIDRGKDYLYSRQLNGNWEVVSKAVESKFPNSPSGLQYGGLTALTTFALLSCGESPQNEHLKQAITFLEKCDMKGNYALGLRAQVWNLLPEDATIKKLKAHDRELLLAAIGRKTDLDHRDAFGFMWYGPGLDDRGYDHSVSQFGVLGLWSLVQSGQEVETHYWRDMDKAWRNQRQPDGSWCYMAHPFPDHDGLKGLGGELLSMTAAGVATLFITQDYANVSAKCEGNQKDPDIEAGMQWIGTHLDGLDANDWSTTWRYYTLFGICRIGLAGGYKYIGTTDWFKWGTDILLKEQDTNSGAWGGGTMMSFGGNSDPIDQGTYDTAFSLLFLSRGRAPVLFNKLQYNVLKSKTTTAEANWNQRPRDVANLTRYLAKASETQLNWQIVNLQEAAADLIDAPLLYMSGNDLLKLTPADMDKLHDYINEGGIIVGHPDCGSAAFANSFKQLGQAMFPGQTFHDLPADHPIYHDENFPSRLWSPAPRLEVLDNGARVQMILLPLNDPARQWQTQSFLNIQKDTIGQMMMDIYLYAVDKQGLRAKGDSFIVKRRKTVEGQYTAKIARLQYDGNWNPEPGGWTRISNYVHNHNHLDITVDPIQLGQGKLTNDYKLAHLTGTAVLTLTDAQRDELKKYIEGGGTLLVDAAGGKSGFAVSATEQLRKIFPDIGNPQVMDLSSPVYQVGDPITSGTVGYRHFARTALGSLKDPQIRGVKIGDRYAILISNEDLSVGLVGQPVDGIIGYDPASATHLVQNIILYATKTPTGN